MKFVNFLDDIPPPGTYLAKVLNGSLGWNNRFITYWGVYDDSHFIEDHRGAALEAKNVKYLKEGMISNGCDCEQPSCSICN